ncbi:hypothetical protein [Thiohalorhabdus methylotrophus]|uniref:Uncharacterized protein n=1 Tax=Thiohalorhabdus methylotrophus TaxID=3242694 RepID=A0ABV4TWH2_9GAMM
MTRAGPRGRVWGAPLALALLSGIGLVAALLSDGFGDVLSWAALTIPTVVSLLIGARATLPDRF